jgi:hypothetical protein
MAFLMASTGNSVEIPQDGLLVRVQAAQVRNNSDAFLTSISNLQRNGIIAQQTDVNKRPLFIKDYAQSQPAISVAGARGIRFRTIDRPAAYNLIIGFYAKSYDEEYPSFMTAVFNERTRANQQNGFSYVFENRSLYLTGEPGYDCAITELLFYNRRLGETELEDVLGNLESTYGIRTDARYADNGIKIDAESLYGFSNMLKLSDGTLLCFVVKKAMQSGLDYNKLETVRSYDSGRNFSSTSNTLSRVKFYNIPSVSIFQLDAINTFALVFARDELSDLPQMEQEAENPEVYNGLYIYRSADEGFEWIRHTKIDATIEKANVSSLSGAVVAGDMVYFLVNRNNNVPLLASAEADTTSVMSSSAWSFEPINRVVEIPPSIDPAMESFSLASDGETLHITYASQRGHILKAEAKSRPTAELKAASSYCRYFDGNYVMVPGTIFTRLDTANDNGMIILAQMRRADEPSYVNVITESKDLDGNSNGWNQPEVLMYAPSTKSDKFELINIFELADKPALFYKAGDTARLQYGDQKIISFMSRDMKLRSAEELVLEISKGNLNKKKTAFASRAFKLEDEPVFGLTLELFAELKDDDAPEELVVFNEPDNGIIISRSDANTFVAEFKKSARTIKLSFKAPLVLDNAMNHFSLIVDYSSGITYAVINGQIVPAETADFHAYNLKTKVESVSLGSGGKGKIETVRAYDRALQTAEIIRNPE